MTFGLNEMNKMVKDCERRLIRACVSTVNVQAAETRRNAIEEIKAKLTLRNNWTEKNIVFTQCPKSVNDINQIQSEVGSRLDYMERQEKGGTRKPQGGDRLAIANTNARGGNNSKKIMKKYNLSTMKIVKGEVKNMTAAKTHRSRLVARAFMANKNHLLLSEGGTLFTVNKFEKDGKIRFEKTPMYNVKFQSTETPATPWLEPATAEPIAHRQEIFNFQADKEFMS